MRHHRRTLRHRRVTSCVSRAALHGGECRDELGGTNRVVKPRAIQQPRNRSTCLLTLAAHTERVFGSGTGVFVQQEIERV